jgi:hypothetical protein
MVELLSVLVVTLTVVVLLPLVPQVKLLRLQLMTLS